MLTGIIRPIILSRPNSINISSQLHDTLTETVRLAEALPKVSVRVSFIVKLRNPSPGKLLGIGKVRELGAFFAKKKLTLIILDGELTPIQQRNLEKDWQIKVLDRTGLILEIFGARASSREGVLQVELAHLNYQKSRLVRSWTHLERQRGGMGFLGGPGETQIEADKRAINTRIIKIKQSLARVVKTRGLHRSARKKIPYPTVALVGYTNAGKSSLFNRLTGAGALTQDMLFSTLDPKMKGLKLPCGQKLIVSDTVGFISSLPTLLVAAFRATLEEVITAEVILHVRDLSSENFREQGRAVVSVLNSLGVEKGSKPIIEVWNKEDKLRNCKNDILNLKQKANEKNKVLVSALTGKGIDRLLHLMSVLLSGQKKEEIIFIPFKKNRSRAWLIENNILVSESVGVKGSKIRVCWNGSQKSKFASVLSKDRDY